jgi:hypothetical protein
MKKRQSELENMGEYEKQMKSKLLADNDLSGEEEEGDLRKMK